MNYVKLNGLSINEEIENIKIILEEDSGCVFVYNGYQKLHEYIDELYANGKGLSDTELYSFKVCYEKPSEDTSLDVTLQKNENEIKIKSMSDLIKELDSKSDSRIIVENDNRNQLSFIVQQLIFIEYPLEKVDILLRKEEKDAEKTKRFMNDVNELLKGCNDSINKLQELKTTVDAEDDDPTKEDRIKDVDESLQACIDIEKKIKKSMEIELKLAVAASKKAGKSVIVNCFLGKEIAPTSVELATPNNCFYKKSRDNNYSFRIEKKKFSPDGNEEYYLPEEGTDEYECYKTSSLEDIHNEIDKRFKEAQKDSKGGFSLPDMHIEYVSDKNNFSSYTIFDTAGPDAAVSIRDSNGNEKKENQHEKSAMRAVNDCDVAVFAIDYSKYLTTSEEDYLKKVKKIFTDNNKFHSLIFALNKIDARYMDANSVKSCIKSVDFIKTRMTAIDEKYKDCIIFPTSSLEYFYAIEAENAGVTELDAKNNLPIEKMRDVTFAHKDCKSLPWLLSQSGYLSWYHGIKTISYDVFKKDSGMPALMSYVSYVAQSKAREEIVNNVTFQIATRKEKLKVVLDSVENLEAIINADDEKISEIAKIITEYSDNVNKIIGNNEKFSDEELSDLSEDSLLKRLKGEYKNQIKVRENIINDSIDDKDIAEKIYKNLIDKVWNKMKKDEDYDSYQIDNMLTQKDIDSVINEEMSKQIKDAAEKSFKEIEKLSNEIKKIVKRRQEKLQKESTKCKNKLANEQVKMELPSVPEFSFSTELKMPSDNNIKLKYNISLSDSLGELFKLKFWKNIPVLFDRAFGCSTKKDRLRKLKADEWDFKNKCKEEIYEGFKNAIYENKIPDKIRMNLKKCVIENYLTGMCEEISKTLINLSDYYTSAIERFRKAIDDRDSYKEDIKNQKKRKDTIMDIEESTSEFMQIWNGIENTISGEKDMQEED